MRAFLAIELPESMRRRLAGQIEALRPRIDARTVRWVRPMGVHLTLKFLGEISAAQASQVAAELRWETSAHKPFEIEVQGIGCFPDLRRPRVVWLGVREQSGTLAELQRGLERRLAGIGFNAERRSFHPHLTLGRVMRDMGGERASRLGDALAGVEVGSLGRVEVQGVSLMRSDLRPAGAVYTRLHFAPLGASD